MTPRFLLSSSILLCIPCSSFLNAGSRIPGGWADPARKCGRRCSEGEVRGRVMCFGLKGEVGDTGDSKTTLSSWENGEEVGVVVVARVPGMSWGRGGKGKVGVREVGGSSFRSAEEVMIVCVVNVVD
ncbi:hypothetical protein HOY80DRAFT_523959 [Tuber brumale]|nr:hypothetical protein HOY80DRAFT_523959 [Tuber brumale]